MKRGIQRFFDFERSDAKLAAVLIAPTLLLVLGVVAYPLIYSFVISFGDVQFANIKDYDFVGIAQYVKTFTDPEFIEAIVVSAKFVFFTVLVKLVLGTLIAVMLKEKFIGNH